MLCLRWLCTLMMTGLHASKSECCVGGGHVSGLTRGVHTIGVYMCYLRWLSMDLMTGVHTCVSLQVAFEVAGSGLGD